MALIYCPNCGKSVSDKADTCPHCGFVFSQMNNTTNTIKCEDCENEYDIALPACPQCGCPNVRKEKYASKKKKHTGLIVSIVVAVVIVLIGIAGVISYRKAEAIKYYKKMETVSYLMLNGAADSETAGNLINSVWYNAIYEKSDSNTDKYTIVNGYFVDDFNDALSNLFSDGEFIESIKKIKNNQNDVTELMKQLKNPPSEYKEAYEVLKVFYDNYLKMTKMVINPTGSFQTFTDDFNDIDTETVNSYEKMKLYLD